MLRVNEMLAGKEQISIEQNRFTYYLNIEDAKKAELDNLIAMEKSLVQKIADQQNLLINTRDRIQELSKEQP